MSLSGFGRLGVLLVGLGALTSLAVFASLVAAQVKAVGWRSPPATATERLPRPWLWLLLAAVAAGLAIRLIGLDARGMFHSEVWIPGIDLPPGVSWPPPRHGLAETALWHFRFEPHPFGYYLAMLGWTKAFGTSLWSMRMPALILGVGSILMTWRVGALTYGARAGVIAAALLSLHAFHIYWSQAARMYVPGSFLGLVSTWLLIEMTRRREPSPLIEAGYVLSVVAGALTVEFFWPLLCFQIAWTAIGARGPAGRIPRAAFFQALAFILSAPMLSHALIGGRGGAADPPTLRFLVDYFTFGLLFQVEPYRAPPLLIPMALTAGACLFSLFLLVLGLRARPVRETSGEPPAAPALWWLLPAALGSCAIMLGFVPISFVRRKVLAAISVMPFIAIAIPIAAAWIGPMARRLSPRLVPVLDWFSSLTGLVAILAAGPMLALFVVSFAVEVMAARAFAVFIPYVLIVIAAGVISLARTRIAAAALAGALGVLLAVGLYVSWRMPITWRDYQGLSHALQARLRPGDVIFTRAHVSSYTPYYYYLGYRNVVSSGYAQATAGPVRPRVWVVGFEGEKPLPGITDALAGYTPGDQLSAWQTRAQLYTPRPPAAPIPPVGAR